MTAHKHHGNPPYIEVNGPSGTADLPSQPPFVFREVTSRVFPIRANIARLYGFCDQYLNMDIPDTLVQFRPSLPYVYLMVINYGSMSAASVKAQNVGWVAQHEVTFTVPLERWERESVSGAWVFKDWACVSPFIFVDDELSLTTGREVYGWPKVAAKIDADVPLWASDPRAPTRLFCLSTSVFPRLYDGAREEFRDLLQIDRDSVPRFSEMPPDRDNPWNPLSILSSAARNGLNLMGDAADMVLRSRLRGYRNGWDLASIGMMSRVAGRNLGGMMPSAVRGGLFPLLGAAAGPQLPSLDGAASRRPGIDMVTLKQFRDTHDPTQACYQALVNSRMTIERMNRCGLLGDYNLLRGDPSGGYAIRIHRYAAQPIVDCLGLDVTRTEEGRDVPVSILKPTFPFWTDVDLHYGAGQVLCWRAQCTHPDARCTDWQREADTTDDCTPAAEDPAHTHRAVAHAETAVDRAPFRVPYNTLQGAATQAITGPFHFPDVTLQIYPLPASRSSLGKFLESYLNRPLASEGENSPDSEYRFEPFGSYVYLLVSVQGDQAGVMWSETNNIGWWADKEVSFCVPVRRYRRTPRRGNDRAGCGQPDAEWQFIGLGIVSPFIFANSARAVITDRETNGRPTVKANIDSERDPWLSPSGPIAKRHLLKVETETFPAFFVGQKAEQRPLLEIHEREIRAPTPPLRPPAESAPTSLIRHAERSLHLRSWLRNQIPEAGNPVDAASGPETEVRRYHLKQYRDSQHLETACYQALVQTPRYMTQLFDLREIDRAVEVRLTLMPAYPIAASLGLKVKAVESTSCGVVQILNPARPFWLRAGLREELGQVLCWRTRAGAWTPGIVD